VFDIGFSELVLIFIVGLLVLGPERLPGVIKTGSLWLAKLRRSFNDVRSEIEREIGYDEIKREIHNQAVLDNLKEAQKELKQVRDELSAPLSETNRQLDEARHSLQQLPYDINPLGKSPAATSAPSASNADAELPAANDRPT